MEHYPLPAKVLRHPIPILTSIDRVWFGSEPYVPGKRTLTGYTFVHHIHPDRVLPLTFAEINSRLDTGSGRLEYGAFSETKQFLHTLFNGKNFHEFDEAVKGIAMQRERLFRKYEEEVLRNGKVPRSSATFQAWIDAAWLAIRGRTRSDQSSINPPSVSTFNRRYKEWVKYERNILAIVPRHRGPGNRTLDFTAESLSFAVSMAQGYMSRLKPTPTQVYEDYEALLSKKNEQLLSEGKLTFHKFGKTKFFELIDALPAFDVMAERHGIDAAIKHFAPVLRSFDPTTLGERVEIDELKTDLSVVFALAGMLEGLDSDKIETLKKIRVWLVVAIEVTTRYVLAAKVATSANTQACLDMVRMIMTDKSELSELVGAQTPWLGHIKPTTLYADWGSAFIGDETHESLKALGIEITHPEPGKAKGRPHIESLFHTIGPLFTRFFDGRTFRSIKEKGDYDPKHHASLAASEFSEIIAYGISDMYNIRPHGALGGDSPHNVWVDTVEGMGWLRPPHAADQILAFGKKMTGTIGRYGIIKYGIPYSNDWLEDEHMHRGQRPINVIFDFGYVNSILVETRDGGWREIENKIDLPANLTEAEWTEARREVLAEKRERTKNSYPAMRDAIIRNRENGKAATLRAGLDPVAASPARLEKQRAELFRGFVASPPTGTPIPADTPVLPPPDNLRAGTVARPRPPELEPTPMPVRKSSKFNRKRDDDQ
ncbi:transposase family protein (plasmid) [Rhizobium grahamii]|uniref:Transposase family protein n=1 Tax=Rhizobium grahamii TaxID=1120045 RepID=A0A5Q0CBH5_9HYPH|nr:MULTISPECIES: DDE-type integrase/transposase/recombinase [Rhizobium]QFY62695.1 transposase family protein [Rhizobium grahamii]QRM52561.1 transposase family protein [Rhizobium sp. BG6]